MQTLSACSAKSAVRQIVSKRITIQQFCPPRPAAHCAGQSPDPFVYPTDRQLTAQSRIMNDFMQSCFRASYSIEFSARTGHVYRTARLFYDYCTEPYEKVDLLMLGFEIGERPAGILVSRSN